MLCGGRSMRVKQATAAAAVSKSCPLRRSAVAGAQAADPRVWLVSTLTANKQSMRPGPPDWSKKGAQVIVCGFVDLQISVLRSNVGGLWCE